MASARVRSTLDFLCVLFILFMCLVENFESQIMVPDTFEDVYCESFNFSLLGKILIKYQIILMAKY